MYRLLRPLFFAFNPETAHRIVMLALKVLRYIPFGCAILRALYCRRTPRLEKEIFGIRFKNPVGLAGGFDKNGEYYNDMANFGFGFIEIGSVSPLPQDGNPKPRLFRLVEDKALVNRMGLNNVGVKKVIDNLKKKKPKTIIAVNITKNNTTPIEKADADYEKVFALAYDFADMFVLNISCPNVKSGCLEFGTDEVVLGKLVESVRNVYRGCLIVKLTPNVTSIEKIAQASQQAGADAVSLINTVKALGVKLEFINGKFKKSTVQGGLSGRAIKPIALGAVSRVRQVVDIPIIGMGGIYSLFDIFEFFSVGADMIQIGTANFTHPDISGQLVDELKNFMTENGFSTLKELKDNLRGEY